MPAAAIAINLMALLTRLVRSTMIEMLSEDYVRTARAKGLRELFVTSRHALPNALIPLVTVVGLQFGYILGGAVVIETIFTWPGVGLFTIQAILNRDYPVVQASVFILATADPIDQDLSEALKPPFWLGDGSLRHPLGTDHLGRDVYSRLIYGAQISLTISVLAAFLGAIVGVVAGLEAGYLGGRVDTIIMRLVDLNLAFPLILLALAVVALLGANLKNLIIVMAITTWMIYARLVRGLSLGLRER